MNARLGNSCNIENRIIYQHGCYDLFFLVDGIYIFVFVRPER